MVIKEILEINDSCYPFFELRKEIFEVEIR